MKIDLVIIALWDLGLGRAAAEGTKSLKKTRNILRGPFKQEKMPAGILGTGGRA
jgi:hypothetical protein